MIDILRDHTFEFMWLHHARLAHQVQSVLAKLQLCRTKALGGHKYRCPGCEWELPVYNSCRDRHCPLCSGGASAKWLERTARLLLPEVKYFQVVFTLPGQLAAFSMGNRSAIFDLLLRSAWEGLDGLLRESLGVAPAASLVLHTWNQELDVHPHVHALVPGSFPSLDGQQWISGQHPKHKRRRKAYLCDRSELSARFQKRFLAGLEKLFEQGELKFQDPADACAAAFQTWLGELRAMNWNVYIQGPPSEQSQPAHVAKYLARYMGGGPISDARIISYDGQRVEFWARSRNKKNKPRPFPLSGREFVRRWSQHILPKGFTKSRSYGGFHNTKRADYLQRCRELLARDSDAAEAIDTAPPPADDGTCVVSSPKCPRCDCQMVPHGEAARPGWQAVLHGPDRPDWYYAFLGSHGRSNQWHRNGY